MLRLGKLSWGSGRRNQPGMLSREGTPPCAPAPALHRPGLPTPELARVVLMGWAAKTPWQCPDPEPATQEGHSALPQ